MATTPHRTAALEFSNAGGGTLLILTYLNLIPGFLPALALTAVLIIAVMVPALALGVAAAVVLGPPYGIWWLTTHRRRNRRAVGSVSQARR
jgi:hypothetical protein